MMSHDELLPRLHIVSGLHAGADCPLPNRPLTIGADRSADVILHDEGIASIHLVLEPDGGDLRIIVRASNVVVEGTALEQGETVVAALPVSIMLGAVELRCEGAAANAVGLVAPDSRPNNRMVVRSATALLPRTTLGRAAGAGLLVMLVASVIAARVVMGSATPANAGPHVPLLSREDHGDNVLGSTELRQMTAQELAVLDLKDVSLAVDSGIVTATGSVDPAEAPKIHALEVWFDHRFGNAAVLRSEVTLKKPEVLTVSLQSVWDGPNPNIFVRGQRYVEGSTLPDGSVVQKITDRAVILLQHGQPYSLEY